MAERISRIRITEAAMRGVAECIRAELGEEYMVDVFSMYAGILRIYHPLLGARYCMLRLSELT